VEARAISPGLLRYRCMSYKEALAESHRLHEEISNQIDFVERIVWILGALVVVYLVAEIVFSIISNKDEA